MQLCISIVHSLRVKNYIFIIIQREREHLLNMTSMHCSVGYSVVAHAEEDDNIAALMACGTAGAVFAMQLIRSNL